MATAAQDAVTDVSEPDSVQTHRHHHRQLLLPQLQPPQYDGRGRRALMGVSGGRRRPSWTTPPSCAAVDAVAVARLLPLVPVLAAPAAVAVQRSCRFSAGLHVRPRVRHEQNVSHPQSTSASSVVAHCQDAPWNREGRHDVGFRHRDHYRNLPYDGVVVAAGGGDAVAVEDVVVMMTPHDGGDDDGVRSHCSVVVVRVHYCCYYCCCCCRCCCGSSSACCYCCCCYYCCDLSLFARSRSSLSSAAADSGVSSAQRHLHRRSHCSRSRY